MRGKLLAIMLLVISLLAPALSAQELDTYNVIFDIQGSRVKTTMEYIFLNSTEENFVLFLPDDAKEIEGYINGKKILVDIISNDEGNFAVIPLTEKTKTIKLKFNSKAIVRQLSKDYFISYIEPPLDTRQFFVNVVLPEGAYLTKHLSKGSIVPKPTELITNGQRAIAIWENYGVKKGFKMSVFVEYRSNIKYVYMAILGGIVLFSLGMIISKKFSKKSETNEIKKQDSSLDKHLKEEEKAVIDAIKLKEGSTTQATIRVVTGISKSSLSRILMELEERNVVHKEKKGNKNIITLK